jgi:hypothetical protein
MNLLLPLLLGLVLAATPARAIEQNCRSIQAKMEREACYKKQEAELAEKRKQAASKDTTPPYSAERMSQEDAYLKAQLRGICRGC